MPDFNTRKPPQEPNEPNRVRIQAVANKLRTLLIATRPRIVLMANRVRNLLIANRLRTLLIGGATFVFVVVAVSVGLRTQQDGSPETVTCDTEHLRKTGECVYPPLASMVCEAESRAAVDKDTYCREGISEEELGSGTVTCESWYLGKTGECIAPTSDSYEVCEAHSRYGVDDETPCRPSYRDGE
jgi:hypothetical protein